MLTKKELTLCSSGFRQFRCLGGPDNLSRDESHWVLNSQGFFPETSTVARNFWWHRDITVQFASVNLSSLCRPSGHTEARRSKKQPQNGKPRLVKVAVLLQEPRPPLIYWHNCLQLGPDVRTIHGYHKQSELLPHTTQGYKLSPCSCQNGTLSYWDVTSVQCDHETTHLPSSTSMTRCFQPDFQHLEKGWVSPRLDENVLSSIWACGELYMAIDGRRDPCEHQRQVVPPFLCPAVVLKI